MHSPGELHFASDIETRLQSSGMLESMRAHYRALIINRGLKCCDAAEGARWRQLGGKFIYDCAVFNLFAECGGRYRVFSTGQSGKSCRIARSGLRERLNEFRCAATSSRNRRRCFLRNYCKTARTSFVFTSKRKHLREGAGSSRLKSLAKFCGH